jgi:signal transduction histidine kinase/ActR/RegA family two-component response regulator
MMICRTLTAALFWRFFCFAVLPMLGIGLLGLMLMAGYGNERDHEQAKILAGLAGERCGQEWLAGGVPEEYLTRLAKWGGDQAQLFIFDRQGEVLFATGSEALSESLRQNQAMAAVGTGEESIYHFNWRGTAYIGSAVIVPGAGWLALAAYPVTGFGDMLRSFSEIIFIGLLAALVIAGSGAVIFAQRLTRPLAQLGEGAKAIARGDYIRQFPHDLYDEEEVLAATFRDMAAIIEERERQLLASQQQAEQANKAKNLFLANMSHEIRTPMNGVMGMIDLVLGTPLSTEQGECLQLARTSADSLLRLINDLLDFSSIEAGRMIFAEGPFAPREIIDRLIALFTPIASQKGIVLATFIDPGIPVQLAGDVGRLEQVVVNLLGNALKFTEQGTISVRVAAHPAADGAKLLVRFSVTDSGIGIAPVDIDRIFKGFTQLDESSTRKYQGAGLGLTISRQIVEKMGGSMEVTSRPGAGSTFSFIVPLALIETLPPQVGEQRAMITRSMPGGGKKRVLLAEDNLTSRRLVEKLLEMRGLLVVSAADGLELLHHWEETDFDLILMDVQMPKMDGLQATMAIRKRELVKNRRTPIVALTAHAMAEDRERCLVAGMDDYLVKPLRADDLYRICDRYLGA